MLIRFNDLPLRLRFPSSVPFFAVGLLLFVCQSVDVSYGQESELDSSRSSATADGIADAADRGAALPIATPSAGTPANQPKNSRANESVSTVPETNAVQISIDDTMENEESADEQAKPQVNNALGSSDAAVELTAEPVGPSEELKAVVDVLHESVESVVAVHDDELSVSPTESTGSFLKIEHSGSLEKQALIESSEQVASPSDLDLANQLNLKKQSLLELRRQRAERAARLRSLRVQQQIRGGYSPLRPRWNAIPMMSTRYTRPVIYVPVY